MRTSGELGKGVVGGGKDGELAVLVREGRNEVGELAQEGDEGGELGERSGNVDNGLSGRRERAGGEGLGRGEGGDLSLEEAGDQDWKIKRILSKEEKSVSVKTQELKGKKRKTYRCQ
jgi:hypothetical protein